MYLEQLYIPTIGPIRNLYFPVLLERTLNRRSREKGRELPPSTGYQQFPDLSSAPTVDARVHINDQHINIKLEFYGP
jgi:hypothetical protein